MSGSLAKYLEDLLDGLVIGPPAFDPQGELPNMVVYPLFPSRLAPEPPDSITLAEGLRRGVRLRDTGMVNRVHVDNPLPAAILVGESEILIGPTQLRALQFSCLIPPGHRASLPVSCVEERRHTEYQAEFTDTDICPWTLRSFKLEQLARHGEAHQHRIWGRIEDYLEGSGAHSDTRDVRATFAQHAFHLCELRRLFRPHPGQVGLVCAVGQDLFLEWFSAPEFLEDRYEYLLKSALIEAVNAPQRLATTPEQVREFLEQLVPASRSSRVVRCAGLKGNGRSAVFSSQGITGAALMAGGELVHLCAHQRRWGQAQPFAALQGQLEQAHAHWEGEGAPFLDALKREYTRRRRRYASFKNSLEPLCGAPVPNGARTPSFPTEDLPRPPRPRPLAPALHEFFLRLFQQG